MTGVNFLHVTETQNVDPRTQRSREALLAAATSLLRGRHAAEITATDVVKEASVSRPTLYQHFGDLPSLFIAASEARLRTLFHDTLPVVVTDDEAAGRDSIRQLLQQLRNDADFFCHATRGPGGYAVLQALSSVLAERLRSHSPLRPVLDTRRAPEHLADFLAHGTVGLVAQWIDSDFSGENTIEAMTNHLVTLLGFQLERSSEAADTRASSTITPAHMEVA